MAYGKQRRAIGPRRKSGQIGNHKNKTSSRAIIQPNQKRSKLDRSIMHSTNGSNNESPPNINESPPNINNNNDNDNERNTSTESVMDTNTESNNQPKTRVRKDYMFGYRHVKKLKKLYWIKVTLCNNN